MAGILSDLPVHRYKSYHSMPRMTKINTEIIEKFAWIPDLLQKVLRNETTPAVKNSMNTIAKQGLGHGHIFLTSTLRVLQHFTEYSIQSVVIFSRF